MLRYADDAAIFRYDFRYVDASMLPDVFAGFDFSLPPLRHAIFAR